MNLFGDNDSLILAVVIILLLLVTFSEQVSYFLNALKRTMVSIIDGDDSLPCGCYGKCSCKKLLMPDEHFQDPRMDASDPRLVRGGGSDVLMALGYEDGQAMAWDEMIKVTDLDPSIHRNQENFVADVRRFSSGANFTSVADDNTSPTYTNFIGLRRPSDVAVLEDARTQPEEGRSGVLARNKPLIW